MKLNKWATRILSGVGMIGGLIQVYLKILSNDTDPISNSISNCEPQKTQVMEINYQNVRSPQDLRIDRATEDFKQWVKDIENPCLNTLIDVCASTHQVPRNVFKQHLVDQSILPSCSTIFVDGPCLSLFEQSNIESPKRPTQVFVRETEKKTETKKNSQDVLNRFSVKTDIKIALKTDVRENEVLLFKEAYQSYIDANASIANLRSLKVMLAQAWLNGHVYFEPTLKAEYVLTEKPEQKESSSLSNKFPAQVKNYLEILPFDQKSNLGIETKTNWNSIGFDTKVGLQATLQPIENRPKPIFRCRPHMTAELTKGNRNVRIDLVLNRTYNPLRWFWSLTMSSSIFR